MKKLLKTLIFIIVLVCAVGFAQTRLGYIDFLDTQEIFKEFYSLDEDTVDVVCTGTSAIQRGWITSLAYEEDGVASYNLATGSQPFCLVKYIMEEAIRKQDTKVFVVDIRSAVATPSDIKDSYIRRVTDNLQDSTIRYRAVKAAMEYASHGENDVDTEDISHYIKIAKYHSLIDPNNVPESAGVEYYGGFAYYEKSMYNIVPMKDLGDYEERLPMNKYSELALIDLLDYCDSIDAKVIFTLVPFEAEEEQMAQLNSAMDIIRDRNYECINLMSEPYRSEINLDYNKFFYNANHTNFYGSNQVTSYLSKYLIENGYVEDRRGDEKYGKWEEYVSTVDKKTSEKYSEMKKELSEID